MQENIGALYEVIVDGKLRSYRDDRATAIKAGIYLKEQQPTSEVIEICRPTGQQPSAAKRARLPFKNRVY